MILGKTPRFVLPGFKPLTKVINGLGNSLADKELGQQVVCVHCRLFESHTRFWTFKL